MKIYVLYRPRSEHARKVEEFAHDFERQGGRSVETVSLDTRDGAATASLYDITKYPAILVLREDGQLVRMWAGEQMPLMSEVASFANL
jgi:hypothetical protein